MRLPLKHLHYLQHHWGWLGYIVVAVCFAALPLLRDGLTHGYDVHYHMNRLYQYQEQLFAGQFYPRWLEGSHAGYGSPTFLFYPPMFVWAALPFAALGFSLSQQLVGTCVLALIVAATGTYGYTRLWLPQAQLAWLSAVLLVCCSPYLLFNIYFRGAYAEVWAMAWLVWILWGMLLIVKTQRLVYCLPLVLATAMVALSHIPTLLLLGIFGAIAPWLFAEKTKVISTVLKTYASFCIGLLLAAFFLLPAVSLQNAVNIEVMSGFGWGVASNRFIVTDLLKFSPRFNDTDSFDMTLHVPFILGILTCILGLFTLLKIRNSAIKLDEISCKQIILLCSGILLSVVMMTDLSLIVYRYVPILDKIQFSWRWLALAGVFIPLCWSSLIYILNLQLSHWSTYSRSYCSVGLIILLVLFSAGYNIQYDRRSPSYIADLDRIYTEISDFPYADLNYPLNDITRFLVQDQSGNYALSDGPEYLPEWVANRPSNGAGVWLLPEAKPLVDILEGEATISELEWQYGLRRFRVNVAEEAEIALRMFAWPSWHVRLGESLQQMQRQELTYDAATGRLTLRLPSGEYWVEVRYAGSVPERWGWFWSGCGIVTIAGVIVYDYRKQRFLHKGSVLPPQAE